MFMCCAASVVDSVGVSCVASEVDSVGVSCAASEVDSVGVPCAVTLGACNGAECLGHSLLYLNGLCHVRTAVTMLRMLFVAAASVRLFHEVTSKGPVLCIAPSRALGAS